MFQFELVHVRSKVHGPDGLSRRPGQPDDPEVTEEDIGEDLSDWVDRVHGYVHLIQPFYVAPIEHSALTWSGAEAMYTSFDEGESPLIEEKDRGEDFVVTLVTRSQAAAKNSDNPLEEEDYFPFRHSLEPTEPRKISEVPMYAEMPRTAKAIRDDHRIDIMRKWFADDKMRRPEEFQDDDEAWERFIKYAMGFFPVGDRLYRKDRNGAHKIV
ncbi:hypothetical protein H0H92_014011, partial [Tricholoma furcatifolium]